MNDILWVEKYRPQTILDWLPPNELKSFNNFSRRDSKFTTGTAGVGKTTVAKITRRDWLHLHDDKRFRRICIDTLRTKIKNFAAPFRWMVNVNTLFWMSQII